MSDQTGVGARADPTGADTCSSAAYLAGVELAVGAVLAAGRDGRARRRVRRAGVLTVLAPESRGGIHAEHYDNHVDGEAAARAGGTVVLFWIPRDLRTLPGFTANVEFGLDVGLGRQVVLGVPPDCPNPNRYLTHVARRHGVPIAETLTDTVAAALGLVTARHTEGTASALLGRVARFICSRVVR